MKNLSRKLRYSACSSAVTWLDPVPWSFCLAWMLGRRTSWSMEGGIVTIRGGSDCFMDFSESVFECSNFSSLEYNYNYSPIILLVGLVNYYLELLITGRVRGKGVVGLARARHCLPCVYTWIGLTWEKYSVSLNKVVFFSSLPRPGADCDLVVHWGVRGFFESWEKGVILGQSDTKWGRRTKVYIISVGTNSVVSSSGANMKWNVKTRPVKRGVKTRFWDRVCNGLIHHPPDNFFWAAN